jgi:hypothetical protein
MISVRWLLLPLFLASELQSAETTFDENLPFLLKCSAQISPQRAKATIEYHSRRSCASLFLLLKD